MASVNKSQWDSNFNLVPHVINNVLSEFMDLKGSTILDFGCGSGIQTLGLAHHLSPERVVGIDIIDFFKDIEKFAADAGWHNKIPECLSFVQIKPGDILDLGFRPDCIVSWSVFEHIQFNLLPGIFRDHYNLLSNGGYIFLQIDPLYFAPFGSHLSSWIAEPWAHLRYQTNVLQEMLYSSGQNPEMEGILTRTENDRQSEKEKLGPWSCYSTLNRITVPHLIRIAEDAGFAIVKKNLGRTDLVPDENLLEVYHEDVLRTEGVELVMRKKLSIAF